MERIVGFLTPIKKTLDKILIFMCIFLCGAMVVVVSWQVFSRFVLKNPSAISEELANICFVWMGLCASALLYGEKAHMNISFIPEKLGPKKSQILVILSEICTFVMASWVLTYGGYRIAMNSMGQANAAMQWLPIGVIYTVVPVTGAFVVFYAVYNILNAISNMQKKTTQE
ncbi:MAG: TRAP transporter small permease [Succinivibrio sp.]|nr:TRAP transporter small permease [Succinivibrio sp.]